ncbi:MAG: hypothetical protein Q8909_20710, partial [Bacteroidota bacterium]|nr:hypothetical protein [Bacteroidota bacterium]
TIVGSTTDVEKLLIRGLHHYDLFVDVGWFRQLVIKKLVHLLTSCMMDKKWRVAVNKRGPEVVDGHGSARVIETLMQPQFFRERGNNG